MWSINDPAKGGKKGKNRMIFDVEPQESADFQERSKTASALDIPEGVEQAIKISVFAAAINMSYTKVKKWVDKGYIETLYTPAKADRYIPVTELARYEKGGWAVNWELVIDLSRGP